MPSPDDASPIAPAHHTSQPSSDRPKTSATDTFVDAPESPAADPPQLDRAAAAGAPIRSSNAEASHPLQPSRGPTTDAAQTSTPTNVPIVTAETGIHAVGVSPSAVPSPPAAHASGAAAGAVLGQSTGASHGALPLGEAMREGGRRASYESEGGEMGVRRGEEVRTPLGVRVEQTDDAAARGGEQSPPSQQAEQTHAAHHPPAAGTPHPPPPPPPTTLPPDARSDADRASTMQYQDTLTQAHSDAHSNRLTVKSHSHSHSHSHDPADAHSLASASASANSSDIAREKTDRAPREKDLVADDARSAADSAATPAIGSDMGHPADVGDVGAGRVRRKRSRASGQGEEGQGEEGEGGPSLTITLLLTNGARHPFEISGRYLRKRRVEVEGGDPFRMSVYTLKELILKEWRSDWEAPPASPTSIRLISFGKMLDDKAPLSECKFNHDAPNVVHMTLRPPSVAEEDADPRTTKGASQREREADDRTPGCRCVIL